MTPRPTPPRHVAVIDIGKTNAKLALVDLDTLEETAVVTRPNTVLAGPPWPHFDLDGHWEFLLDALAGFHAAHGIDAISVTTHGASIVLLDAAGNLAGPMLDYEHTGPDTTAAAYDAIRPDFAETGSPRLGMGLNIGAQLHWMFETDPALKARTKTILTYPQYWGYRLTGALATDMSSLGCHTDLWNPHEGRFSSLVQTLAIADKIAPARPSADLLGPILPGIAARTGLSPTTPVHAGIHDSNASLLPHILGRTAPFSVVSTGTWVIAMAVGPAPVPLDPGADTLINVSALGQPVPSARFMGGREYALAMGGARVEPDAADIRAVLEGGIMLMPALVSTSGPFQGRKAHWIGREPAPGSGARAAAVAFYLALETAHCLALIGHRGPIIVEGPFAHNRACLDMLAAATGAPVVASATATGTSQGAALLAAPPGTAPRAPATGASKAPDPAMVAYAAAWASLVR
ncbi:MAG: FGGY-family carbohydrate kinase [Maritimibacter sp.]|nr:FGGY-family carbohydrate kinase [Maritimibacter sp.]